MFGSKKKNALDVLGRVHPSYHSSRPTTWKQVADDSADYAAHTKAEWDRIPLIKRRFAINAGLIAIALAGLEYFISTASL